MAVFRHWWLAPQPRTLTIARAPEPVGSTLGWPDNGALAVPVLLAACCATVLIQAGTNLHNDAADLERGADNPTVRLGPARVTALGWLPGAAVRAGAGACFALALLVGGYLVGVGGWPMSTPI